MFRGFCRAPESQRRAAPGVYTGMSCLHTDTVATMPPPLRNSGATGQWAGLPLRAAGGCDMATLDRDDHDGVRVLRLAGSLTQQGLQGVEPDFERALPDGSRAVVDLAKVDLVTTPGITLMLSATQRLRRTGGRVVFTAARGPVLDLLHRCRLDEVLELAGTEPEGVERVKR